MRRWRLAKRDLAVLDVRLAKGGFGPDIARRLKSKGKIGVLYETGDDARNSDLTQADGEASLAKPYRTEGNNTPRFGSRDGMDARSAHESLRVEGSPNECNSKAANPTSRRRARLRPSSGFQERSIRYRRLLGPGDKLGQRCGAVTIARLIRSRSAGLRRAVCADCRICFDAENEPPSLRIKKGRGTFHHMCRARTFKQCRASACDKRLPNDRQKTGSKRRACKETKS